MSNSCGYVTVTRLLKQADEPAKTAIRCVGIILGTAVISSAITSLVKDHSYARKEKKAREKAAARKNRIYTVTAPANLDRIPLTRGATFKVLTRDKDAVVIDIVGDNNNPYVIDYDLIQSISDYE